METVYDDYKFVTKKELEDLGLSHLIGKADLDYEIWKYRVKKTYLKIPIFYYSFITKCFRNQFL